MAGSVILSGNTLAAGLRADFDRTYQQSYAGVEASLGTMMELNIPSDKRTELYALHRTMPYPERWDLGSPIPTEGTDSLTYSVTNYRYAKAIEWERDDRMDNQIGDLFAKASRLGENFASLDSRIFIELLTGTASLLPAIPNAPDGAALYASTAGGAARFGLSGGNIETGGGVATTAAIISDFFDSIERFGGFQNTKGQPFFEPDVASSEYVVYFNVANTEIFTQSFKTVAVHSVVSTTGARVDNVILASGVQVRLVPTQRITDNDWFIFRTDAPVRPLFCQQREGLRQSVATEENSDVARNTGVESIQFVVRKGYGVNVPFATVKVNN